MDSHAPPRLRMNCAGLWWVATVSRKMPMSVPATSSPVGMGGWMGSCPARLNTVPGAPQARKVGRRFHNPLGSGALTNYDRCPTFARIREDPAVREGRLSMRRSSGLRWPGACLPLLALTLAGPQARAASAEAEIEAGAAAYAAGSLDSARAAFGRAVHLEGHNFTALRWLARAESDLGEDARGEDQRALFARAVEHARSAVQVAPD